MQLKIITERNLYLEFNCNVRIVEGIMGSGKSFSAMNHINNSDDNEKFLVTTPYLDEI